MRKFYFVCPGSVFFICSIFWGRNSSDVKVSKVKSVEFVQIPQNLQAAENDVCLAKWQNINNCCISILSWLCLMVQMSEVNNVASWNIYVQNIYNVACKIIMQIKSSWFKSCSLKLFIIQYSMTIYVHDVFAKEKKLMPINLVCFINFTMNFLES